MPRYIDTHGHTLLAIAICARCSCKYPRDELSQDPNYPGLLVCPDGCKDEFDPYRLPARSADKINFDNPRPDVPIYGVGPSPRLYADPIMVEVVEEDNDILTESGEIITTEGGQPLTTEG